MLEKVGQHFRTVMKPDLYLFLNIFWKFLKREASYRFISRRQRRGDGSGRICISYIIASNKKEEDKK